MANLARETAKAGSRGLVRGQVNLKDVVDGSISYQDARRNHVYKVSDNPARLFAWLHGWHLPEAHTIVDREPLTGCLVDFGLYFFHNQAAFHRSHGPFFYLPKMEHSREAVNHEHLSNDQFFLIFKGLEQFRVTGVVQKKPYLFAEVSWLEDRPTPTPEVEEDLEELVAEVESYMKDVIRLWNRVGGKPENKEVQDLRRNLFPTPFSFFVGSTFEGAPREQQTLLELEDIVANQIRRTAAYERTSQSTRTKRHTGVPQSLTGAEHHLLRARPISKVCAV